MRNLVYMMDHVVARELAIGITMQDEEFNGV